MIEGKSVVGFANSRQRSMVRSFKEHECDESEKGKGIRKRTIEGV
jgi:hypothetical protein